MIDIHKFTDYLKNKVGKDTYNLWFAGLKQPFVENDSFIFAVPDEFFMTNLKNRFQTVVEDIISFNFGKKMNVVFEIRSGAVRDRPKNTEKEEDKEKQKYFNNGFNSSANLNHKYSFENFVVGDSNQFAHAAAVAVSNNPGNTPYNPLFIYGGVGLGKTHLMQAIGNTCIEKFKNIKVLYISSDAFRNELTQSIRKDTRENFRNKFRNIDVLLLDDVQLFSGADFLQEEVLNTFNKPHDLKKQLVFTSDKSPKAIPKLEERIRSRFSWGIITDIQTPNLGTRLAILKKKSEDFGVYISDEVIQFIATHVKTNVRELENALKQIVGYSTFLNKEITIAVVKDILKQLIEDDIKNKDISVTDIQKSVSDYFHLNISDMKSKKRTNAIAFPRQIAMYLARDITDLSLIEIGMAFGGKDHSTVFHAYEKISKQLEKDEKLNKIIKNIKESFL